MSNKNEAGYMGTKEAAKLWGVNRNTISRWCRENRIPGAEQDAPGSPWRIPRDAKCPNHRRTQKK